jgi:hypothetical protein
MGTVAPGRITRTAGGGDSAEVYRRAGTEGGFCEDRADGQVCECGSRPSR